MPCQEQDVEDVVGRGTAASSAGAKKKAARPTAASGSGAASAAELVQEAAPEARPAPAEAPLAAGPVGAPGRFQERLYDREAATAWLPVATGCHIVLANEGRQWQVKYLARAVRPKSRSITFATEGEGATRAHVTALRQCIAWAWSAHEEVTGQACPWPLDLPWEDAQR